MGSEIVCQVIGRQDQVTFIWSEGPASFEPYQLTGQGFVAFRNLATQAREALSLLVKDYLQGTDEDVRRSGFALAKVGSKLYQQIFRPAAGPSQYVAKRVRTWLGDLYGQDQIESLEIVMDGFGPIPWNVVYDQEPKEADFVSGADVECWRPFWGLRYNLAGGRRVEPLRRLPWLINPKLLMVIDPAIRDGLPDDQKQRLAEFLLRHTIEPVVSKEGLAIAMEASRPDVMYWLCHASASALILDGEEVSPGDLLDLFRSQADDDRLGGIAFLNACQTAEATEEGGSFMDALHEVGLSGVIATEHQTVDTFAHPFGLDFLEAFLYEGQPIGALLHDLRSKGVPLGLLYSTYCPPGIRVLKGEGTSDERKILAASRLAGTALSAPSAPTAAKLSEARRSTAPLKPMPLPEAPYRLLAPFGRRDRALFVGRDDDIRRFSLILDDHATRLIVLHGESGVGKSSFLRAGVIPYLEEECVGYQFVADRSSDPLDSEPRFLRATSDLVGQVARALCEFLVRGYAYRSHSSAKLRSGKKRSKSRRDSDELGARPMSFGFAEIDLAEVAAGLIGGPLRPEVIAAALRADVDLFGRLMREASARLPVAPVLVIDQAEEVFTLARTEEELENGRLAMAMLRRAMGESGNFKLIVSLRTEYYGRFVDRLRSGVREAVGLREYLLTEFRAKGLVEALLRPTSDRAIEGSTEIPFEKYGFRYEDGVAERIAREVLDGKLAGQDSVLPLIQVIGSQLFEAAGRPDAVIGQADLDAIGGVKGGMRRHVDRMVAQLLIDRPSDARPFRMMMSRLYLRQPDGALTTALMPLDALEADWKGKAGFADMIRSAVGLRLLNVSVFDVDGADGRPYASLGHDALARVVAAWDEDLQRSERLRKMVLATAASLLLAGVMGALGIIALIQKVAAERATGRALGYLRETIGSLDHSVNGIANVELADIPQMLPFRARQLKEARDSYARLVSQLRDGRPEGTGAEAREINREMGRAYRSLGNVDRLVGHNEDSRGNLAEAIKCLDEARADGRDNDAELARAHRGMGQTLRLLDEINDAEQQFASAIKIGDALVKAGAGADEVRFDLAASHYSLAALLAEFTDRFEESRAEYKAALSMLPTSDGYRTTRARYTDNLGRLELACGDLDLAEKLFNEAGEILEARFKNINLPGTRPDHRWQQARVFNNKALIAANRGQAGGVDPGELFLGSRTILARLCDEFPQVEAYRKELALVEENIAIRLLDKSISRYVKCLEARKSGAPQGQILALYTEAGNLRQESKDGLAQAIKHLTPLPPSGDDTSPPGKRSAEVEWPQLAVQSDFQLAKMWDGITAPNPDALHDDLKLMNELISRLEGKLPRPGLPKYHDKLATIYWSEYRVFEFYLKYLTRGVDVKKHKSSQDQARAALEAAVTHGERAANPKNLRAYQEALESFKTHYRKGSER